VTTELYYCMQTADLLSFCGKISSVVIASVRCRQLTDTLQIERDALLSSNKTNEVKLQQQTAEIQQLHAKVRSCGCSCSSCHTILEHLLVPHYVPKDYGCITEFRVK